MVQTNIPFDRYMKGDKTALTEQQVRGLKLFQGKAGCIQCHNGPMFADEKYYNLGVPLQESFLREPLQQITHRFEYFSKGVTESSTWNWENGCNPAKRYVKKIEGFLGYSF